MTEQEVTLLLQSAKAKGFDLYQSLESAEKHIQAVEKVIQQIAEVSNYQELNVHGLGGLVNHIMKICTLNVNSPTNDSQTLEGSLVSD